MLLVGFHWLFGVLYAVSWAGLRAFLWGEGRILRRQYEARLVRVRGAEGGEGPAASVSRAARLVASIAASTLITACSSGGDGDDDGASLGDTAAPTEVTAPEIPAASPAGTGVVVVGGTTSSFAVTACRLEPAAAAEPPSALLLLTGEGTTGGGMPFQIEVQRFATSTSVDTFTDTVSYTDTARILQIQRFEVAGEVTDLRDPDARGTLLRVRPDGLSTAGIAGPPGAVAGEDEGIMGLALDATC